MRWTRSSAPTSALPARTRRPAPGPSTSACWPSCARRSCERASSHPPPRPAAPPGLRQALAGGRGVRDRRLAAIDRATGLRPATHRLQPGHLHGVPARAAAGPGGRPAGGCARRPLGPAPHAGGGQRRAGAPAAAAAGRPRPTAALDRLCRRRGGGRPRPPLPAGQNAQVPATVPAGELVAANSLTGITDNLARLVGGPLGGVILEVAGLAGVVACDAASFLVAALLLANGRARGRSEPEPLAL